MNDDLFLLASAYVDGELTPEERARVDRDPGALAEVERLQAIRAALQEIAPPDAARRDTAIAAALAVFDGADARPASSRRSVTPLRRRIEWRRPLAIAAAVAAVGALGLVAANALRSSGDDTASVAPPEMVDARTDAPAGAAPAEPSTEATLTASEAGGDGDAVAQMAEAALEARLGPNGTELTAPIVGEEQLAAAGRLLADLADNGDLIVPTSECELDTIAAEAMYAPDPATPAIAVFVVTDDTGTRAVDRTDCHVVADSG